MRGIFVVAGLPLAGNIVVNLPDIEDVLLAASRRACSEAWRAEPPRDRPEQHDAPAGATGDSS
jgi:hypothetical protein